MPPLLTWFVGRDPVARFLGANLLLEPGGLRTVRTRANDQDALGVYSRGPDGVHRAHAVIVLTVAPTGITRMVAFQDPGLFPAFGLPSE